MTTCCTAMGTSQPTSRGKPVVRSTLASTRLRCRATDKAAFAAIVVLPAHRSFRLGAEVARFLVQRLLRPNAILHTPQPSERQPARPPPQHPSLLCLCCVIPSRHTLSCPFHSTLHQPTPPFPITPQPFHTTPPHPALSHRTEHRSTTSHPIPHHLTPPFPLYPAPLYPTKPNPTLTLPAHVWPSQSLPYPRTPHLPHPPHSTSPHPTLLYTRTTSPCLSLHYPAPPLPNP